MVTRMLYTRILYARLIGAVLVALFNGLAIAPEAVHAAPRDLAGPVLFGPLQQEEGENAGVAAIRERVRTVASTIASLAFIFVLISVVVGLAVLAISGAVPEWAYQRRGTIMTAIAAGILLSFSESIVSLFITEPAGQ